MEDGSSKQDGTTLTSLLLVLSSKKKEMDTDWLKHLARLNLPVYQYESDKMRIAYAGYSSIKKNYYVRLMLDRDYQHTFLGRRWFWQIPKLIKSKKLDIVISEISPIVMSRFQNWDGYIIPEWVRMKININRPISEICRASVSDFADVKRMIRKYNLSYELLTGEDSFAYFNDKFYMPYITKRHGEEAWIEDLKAIWDSAVSPLLLVVSEDGVRVGASMLLQKEESLLLSRLGLLDGNDEYRRHGVIGAIYYFSLLEGQKMGCQYLDVGGTRPFVTDGLTRYKMNLGAQFVSFNSSTSEYLWLVINEHSEVAENFMISNPVMHVNKDFSLTLSGDKKTVSSG